MQEIVVIYHKQHDSGYSHEAWNTDNTSQSNDYIFYYYPFNYIEYLSMLITLL